MVKTDAGELTNAIEQKADVLTGPIKDLRKKNKRPTPTQLRKAAIEKILEKKKPNKRLRTPVASLSAASSMFSLFAIGQFLHDALCNRKRFFIAYQYVLFLLLYAAGLSLFIRFGESLFAHYQSLAIGGIATGGILFYIFIFQLIYDLDCDRKHITKTHKGMWHFIEKSFLRMLGAGTMIAACTLLLIVMLVGLKFMQHITWGYGWIAGLSIFPLIGVSMLLMFIYGVVCMIIPAAVSDQQHSIGAIVRILIWGFIRSPFRALINYIFISVIALVIFVPLTILTGALISFVILTHGLLWNSIYIGEAFYASGYGGYVIMAAGAFWLVVGVFLTLMLNYYLSASYYLYYDLKNVIEKKEETI